MFLSLLEIGKNSFEKVGHTQDIVYLCQNEKVFYINIILYYNIITLLYFVSLFLVPRTKYVYNKNEEHYFSFFLNYIIHNLLNLFIAVPLIYYSDVLM